MFVESSLLTSLSQQIILLLPYMFLFEKLDVV